MRKPSRGFDCKSAAIVQSLSDRVRRRGGGIRRTGIMTYSLSGKRVWVAGHRGMVGSAIVRRLATEGCEVLSAARDEVDLTRQAETEDWIAAARPHAVFLAAGRVGGIHANDSY